ncbi:GumC family protein [Vibrio vulnificus]|uniref:GumC family protein n=1 Tax=Vibrio vulnificus TaxID=672 RepID=UPI000CD05F0E|nr:polysaccharide biosynthesis tyrosine autokinase [Vibrio vulnificus]POC08626.1 capsular biosynthesis protein [Vibrio vulnificus]HAS8107948.1 capsular biosynthesis protein [Vibrio vulnificus]HAS8156644.1 capsular biosynthesis protein [Vibrio vulnificus]HAS8300943.1 capsular biosynthesis protein [Vibrio vulnificus]HAS8548526.1 capsular biosynthesis protein [Vibrio vulnificus]
MAAGMVARGKKVENSIDFTPFLKALKKNGLKIVLFTALVTGASVPLIMSMESKYISTAAVLLKAQADNATPIEQVDGYDSTRAQYYETQLNLMQSRVVLERVVTQLKLDENSQYNRDKIISESPLTWQLPEQQRMDNAIKTLRKGLTFTPVRLTQLVYVSYESSDAAEAARIANAVAQGFIDYSVEQKMAKTQSAQQWNESQMAELREQVAAKKKEMERFLDKEGLLTFRGIDGFETEELGITTNKLADAKERRLAAQAQYEIVLNNIDAPLDDIAAIPEISSHPQLQDLRIAMIQAKRKLYDLQNKYGPKHNKVLEAKAQIQAIEGQTKNLLNELKDGLYKQYQAALTKENRYKALLNEQKKQFRTLVAKRDQYESMKLDLQKTEDLYKSLFLRSKEQSLTAQYREPDALIYDPAVAAERPQKPNKKLLLVMVFVLSLMIALLFVIVRTAMNQTVSTLAQLPSKLGLVPLADLPEFAEGVERSALAKLIASNQQAMETIHGINSAVLLKAPTARTLGVVASCEGEGASLVAQLMAQSLAANHRTLLVDLDYRTQTGLSLPFESQSEQEDNVAGFAQWLDAEQQGTTLTLSDFVQPMEQGGDWLPRGVLTQSPLLMLGREGAKHAFEQLALHYDRVVVNLPSLHENKDAQLIAKWLDQVLVVIQADTRQATAIRHDLAKLEQEGVGLLGGVLNRVNADELISEESLAFVTHGALSALDNLGQ